MSPTTTPRRAPGERAGPLPSAHPAARSAKGCPVSAVLDVFSIVAIVAGLVFFLAGTVGLLRFPDAYTRLHALTKADNLGVALVVIGLLPQMDGVLPALKLVLVWLLVMLSSAAVSQLIARSVRRR